MQVALLAGQQEEHLACKKLSDGMLVWLCVREQICMYPSWCHCHSLGDFTFWITPWLRPLV